MVYLGRVVGVGHAKDGKPAIIYAVSGRSEASKARKATLYPTRVHIGPLDGNDSDPLRHYDAIKTAGSTGVVSNGRHTNGIYRAYPKGDIEDVERVMNRWGAEKDEPIFTPRIFGITSFLDYIPESDEFYLGIISYGKKVRFTGPELKEAEIKGLSTYKGTEPSGRIITNDSLDLLDLPAEGKTAQKLVDDMFDWMDQDLVVCTVSAVFDKNRGRWQLAVRNRYGN